MPSFLSSHWRKSVWATIAVTACIVAVVDALAAVLITVFLYNGNTVRLFQYIASGLLGGSAFTGGLASAAVGVLIHLLISVSWTTVFFVVHPVISRAVPNLVVRAMLYGGLIWTAMNILTLPITRVAQGPFSITTASIGIATLIIAAGLPMVYQFDRFYHRTKG